MNSPKCDNLDYTYFLNRCSKAFTCTEAERCQPESANKPAIMPSLIY